MMSRRQNPGLFAVALLQLLLISAAWAQQNPTATVSGTVTDAETGAPLAGANVFVDEGSQGIVTGDDGRYALTLAKGSYDLTISYLGYKPDTLRLTLDDDVRIDAQLQPTATALDEVSVVGHREDVHSTMSAIHLPVSELERLPAFLGEVDVIKAIQLLPGVQSGAEGTTGLYVRGGGPDQNLILLDGTPVYNPGHVFGFLSVFNPSALDDVRLVKGGFPARFGGRLSSVVDLEMKQGSRDEFDADGTIGLVFSSLTAEGPIAEDKASFIVSARRTYIDVLARPFINRHLQDGQSFSSYFYDANAKVDYSITPRSSLELSAYFGQDVYASADETFDSGGRDRYAAGADWGNLVSSLAWRHQITSRLSSRAALALSGYHFDVFTSLTHVDERDPPRRSSEEITYRSGITDWIGSIDMDYQASTVHRLRFGAGAIRHVFNPGVTSFQIESTDEATIDSTLTPNAFRSSTLEGYAYLEDEAHFGSRWKANVGVRLVLLDAHGTSYASAQPRLSVRYMIGDRSSIRSSFSTMQQNVHLLTNSGLHLPTDLWVSSTRKIAPQKSWQGEAAAVYGDERHEASLEVFYKHMYGLIEYEPGASYLAPNQDWQEKVVAGNGQAYGLELYLRRRLGRLSGWIGYTLSWSTRQFDGLNEGASFPYRYDRRHDVSVVANYQISDRIDVGATWVYGTGQAITLSEARYADGRLLDPRSFTSSSPVLELREYGERGGYRMASYHRLDLALNIDFGSVIFFSGGESTLSLGAYNVYNRRNPFYLFEGRRKDGSRVYKQASLFPIIPFVSYRFRF